MDWCVYVGQKAKKNYKIGLDNGVWGHKMLFSSSRLSEMSVGDRVFFFHDIYRLTRPVGIEKKGNLRIASEHYERLAGIAKDVKICEVTKPLYQDESLVWSDDTYQFRYDIKLVEHKTNILIGVEFQGDRFVKSLLASITSRGSTIPIDEMVLELDGFDTNEGSIDGEKEGRPFYRLHKQRERSNKLSNQKKKLAKEAGILNCEACGFDFEKAYGSYGSGFIECHHTNPLAIRDYNEITKLDDLSLLCSNCHRMIHRSKQWLTIEQLKGILND